MFISFQTTAETCATLGQRARQARLSQNLTQADLAGRAGISLGAVRKLEDGGHTTLATFVKCVQALGAAQELENLLSPQVTSIAQMERESEGAVRKRARRSNPAPAPKR